MLYISGLRTDVIEAIEKCEVKSTHFFLWLLQPTVGVLAVAKEAG